MAAALAREIARCLPADRKDTLGVAVSGGGDSLALLHLLCDLTRDTGPRLAAVTVDHGLRPESADEAAMVGSVCAGLGVEHEVLRWDGWDGQGNLQERARQARYELIAVWAGKRGIGRVALGHTQDDQAETVLMGLARGAGVDGLSAMAPTMNRNGIEWLRPMLGLRRQDLRAYLTGEGVTWADDPSNDDSRFERIRVRHALSALADVGIGVPGLAEVATRMRSARDALTARTDAAAREIARIEAGAVVLDRAAFLGLEEEIARRLLLRALCWINGSRHAPRRAAARQVIHALRHDTGATTDGCHATQARGAFWIFREFNAVRDVVCRGDADWDGRWRVNGPQAANLTVRALGPDGLAHCPEWRQTGRPHAVLVGSPSLWDADRLVSAPFAGVRSEWHFALTRDADAFRSGRLSH